MSVRLLTAFSLRQVFNRLCTKAWNSTCTRLSPVTATTDGKKLKLTVQGDGEEKRYHGVWLRHNCRCPQCYSQVSQASTVHPHQLTDGLEIKGTTIKDDMIYVTFESGHTAEYNLDWLIQHNYTDKDVQKKKRVAARPLVTETLPTLDYRELMSSTEGHFEWVKQLNHYGISLLHNVPLERKSVDEMVEKLGYIQETIYGRYYDVIGKEDPVNLAYGFADLNFHMDLLYYESPPGLQILHCVRNDPCVTGGESIMLDTYPVVNEMRLNYPKQFEVLTRVPVTFQRIHHSHDLPCDLRMTRKHIVLDKFGEISAVHWNPHGHYPMCVSEDDVEEYYEAFILLSRLFDESKWKITHRLEPGEAFTFNNRRIVHARNAFVLNGGMRHLQGAYVKVDFIRSQFEVLSKLLGKKEQSKNILIENMG